ncbi:ImmA/IrrE family metallo-endopeptidase [Cryobacterium sp. M96]|uniref:ImmA/IrrE family metallo-endopeptidase n=1 Tax=Cryobacterium sp. M96 TaxID=2048295 RepID=UPI0018EA795E|nr:ImmA/IrrE family metallo-endopeptidase [Cryobacterium sp. M96]
MRATFDDAPAQVEAMLSAWEALGGSLDDLTLDAFAALEQRVDLSVLRVPELIPADSHLGCSVAGGYRWEPPTLVVTESLSRRRQQFTLLHELGHHIQKTNIDLGTKIVEHRDPEAFEDACCDAFAARILLPDDLVNAHISNRGPSVRTAVELFETSSASRAAICVRLANRLQSPGAVVVVTEDGIVTFAAAGGGLYPPARGSDQTENSLVRAALGDDDDSRTFVRDDAQIWYRDGHTSERLYGQGAWAGDLLFLVMVEYSAPWLAMSPPRDGTVQHTTARWEQCEHCNKTFVIRFICHKCGQPRCRSGHCGCTSKMKKTCVECFLQKHSNQFAPGSKTCLECAS